MKMLALVLSLLPTVVFGAGKDIYGNDLTRTNLLGYVDGGVTTVGDIADFAKSSGGADTNAVRSLIDALFDGGTQKVNRVVGSFDGVSNRVSSIEADLPGVSNRLDTIEGDLPGISNRVESLETSTNNLMSLVSGLTSMTNTWNAKVSNITTNGVEVILSNNTAHIVIPEVSVVAPHSYSGITGKAADSGAYAEAKAVTTSSVVTRGVKYTYDLRNSGIYYFITNAVIYRGSSDSNSFLVITREGTRSTPLALGSIISTNVFEWVDSGSQFALCANVDPSIEHSEFYEGKIRIGLWVDGVEYFPQTIIEDYDGGLLYPDVSGSTPENHVSPITNQWTEIVTTTSYDNTTAEKAYKDGNGNIISATYTTTNAAMSIAEAVAVPTVNRVKNLHWDSTLQVTWTNVVDNGHIYYVTVTNTNISVAQ